MPLVRVFAAILLFALCGASGAEIAGIPPGGGRPARYAPFPTIADWSSLKITLTRNGVAGGPAYSVEVHGDGEVIFAPVYNDTIPGRHVTHIPPRAVRALVSTFQRAQFFWLYDRYSAMITDMPTVTVGIAFDGNEKTLEDYMGADMGMPRAVTQVEAAIDRVAGTEKWLHGNGETFAALQAEDWDFHATDETHLRLIYAAARSGDRSLLAHAIAAGVPAGGLEGCEALGWAAQNGRTDLMQILLAAGAQLHWDAPIPADAGPNANPRDFACDVAQFAAKSGVPAAVQLILSRHPDIGWRDGDGRDALWLLASFSQVHDRAGQDFARCAALLIAAGAAVDTRDTRDGTTPLFGAVADERLVHVLLKAGADVNATGASGETVLAKAREPVVLRALLAAGADPWKENVRGQTALDIAVQYGDKRKAEILKAWMAAHPRTGGG